MKRVKFFIATLLFGSTALFAGVTLTTETTFAAGGCNADPHFLTFPTWYRGLLDTKDCTLKSPGKAPADGSNAVSLQTYTWLIVLNVIEIALQLVAYLTVFMIIYGGFLFMTNGGEASKIVTARKTIIAALIGLGISSVAIGAVNLIFGLIQ
jgi:hypothetical protein